MSILKPEHFLTVLRGKLNTMIEEATAFFFYPFFPFTLSIPLINLINLWKLQKEELELIIAQITLAQMSVSYGDQRAFTFQGFWMIPLNIKEEGNNVEEVERKPQALLNIEKIKIQAQSLNEKQQNEGLQIFDQSYQSFSFGLQHGKVHKKGPYKNVSNEEKLKAIQLVRQNILPMKEISKIFGVTNQKIRRWVKKGYYGRTHQVLEKELCSWLQQTYTEGQIIAIKDIRKQALSRSTDTNFKASRSWAKNFIMCYDLLRIYHFR